MRSTSVVGEQAHRGQCSGSIPWASGSSDSTCLFRRHFLVSEWYFREVNEPLRRMEEFLNGKGGENILMSKGTEKAVRKLVIPVVILYLGGLCSRICEQSVSINAPGKGCVSRQNTQIFLAQVISWCIYSKIQLWLCHWHCLGDVASSGGALEHAQAMEV